MSLHAFAVQRGVLKNIIWVHCNLDLLLCAEHHTIVDRGSARQITHRAVIDVKLSLLNRRQANRSKCGVPVIIDHVIEIVTWIKHTQLSFFFNKSSNF